MIVEMLSACVPHFLNLPIDRLAIEEVQYESVLTRENPMAIGCIPTI
jgi:hypothetical protein